MSVRLPSGFRPAPTAVARQRAAPLGRLLAAAGLEAVGPLDARYDLAGAPAQPKAEFVAARFLTPPGARGALDEQRLALLLEDWARQEPDLVTAAPQRRRVAGVEALVLSAREERSDDRTRVQHTLLAPTPKGLYVLRLSALDGDPRPWDEAWERLLSGLVLTRPAPRQGGSPSVLWSGLAGAGLAACLVALWLVRARRGRRVVRTGAFTLPPRPRTAPEGLALFDAGQAAVQVEPAPPRAPEARSPEPRAAETPAPERSAPEAATAPPRALPAKPATPVAPASAAPADDIGALAGLEIPAGATAFEVALARRMAGASTGPAPRAGR